MTGAEFKNYMDILKSFYPNAPQLDGVQMTAWYGFFKDLPAEAMFATLDEIPRSCPRFPSIAEILAMVNPKPDTDSEARIIADKIWAAIERFGSLKSKQDLIRSSIGQVGWRVVEQMGGWRVVCEIADYDNVSSLKAQWRESIKAHLNVDKVKAQRDALGLDAQPERTALPVPDEKPAIEAPKKVGLKVDLRSVLDGIKTRDVT